MTMTTIAYPSRELSGLPSVVAEVPEGCADRVLGTTLAARPLREEEFAPKVVTVEQCPTPGSEERA
jgi:hypothetical protein